MPRIPTIPGFRAWWSRLPLQDKVIAILIAVFGPIMVAVAVHVVEINHLVTLQGQHHALVLAREQTQILRRLAVDIEDAFRGYLLTRDERFLRPLREAAPKVKPTTERIIEWGASVEHLAQDVRDATERLQALLESKDTLIRQVKAGDLQGALAYVQSGQGLALSDQARDDLRQIEDRLIGRLQRLQLEEAAVASRTLWGLLCVVLGSSMLAVFAARLLTNSITVRLADLEASVSQFGFGASEQPRLPTTASAYGDEIGRLATACERMAQRINRQIGELQAIVSIGDDINMIGPDGLDGVLRRITDSAASLLRADLCLVLAKNDKIACWVVEAASDPWHDRLYKSVMLWEELPVSVQALETKQPVVGEDLRRDERPEVSRRNRLGESMLAIPLLSQGTSFGVLVLLLDRRVGKDHWNIEVAKAFADHAAVAISNARLLEHVQQQGKGLRQRLRHLEHLAEMLAHDLKGPGERMHGLAAMLRKEYGQQFDERAARWLSMIEDNGHDLTTRVQSLLEVARVGGRAEVMEAVDPACVIHDVLKQRAGELEQGHITVEVQRTFPLVACHRAYLHQVFDNLLSNAIKYAGGVEQPTVRITAERAGDRVVFTVRDNGPGIPAAQRTRVFQPFVRLHPNGSGTGIGLTIVQRIVDLHGGRIWIDEEPTQGCAMKFTFPLLAVFVPPDGERAHESVPAGLLAPDEGGRQADREASR